MVNFIALLGWSPKDDQEVLSIEELIERFDIKDLQKAGARFDEKKMSHINFEHMKRLPIESYLPPAVSALGKAGLVDDNTDQDYLKHVLELCQQKINSFEDLPAFSAYFFSDEYSIDEKVQKKLLNKADAAERIQEVIPVLENLESFDAITLERGVQALADEKELKIFAWFPLLRFAVSGVGGGPDLLPMLETLGREKVVSRLKKLASALPPSA